MTTIAPAAEILAHQRELWNRLAGGWEAWREVVDSANRPVGAAMVDALRVEPDQLHLDVASGTGEPGLTIAGHARRGVVTLTDLAPRMLDVARRRSDELALTNIVVRECSADDLPFADGAFDSLSCRFGLMFVPDVDAAVREMARVVRSGGRVCVAVWAEPAANPWATIPAEAIAAHVDIPPPAADAPGLFRCAARGALADTFVRAGLGDVDQWDVTTQLAMSSPAQYWQLLTEVAAPVVDALSQVGPALRARIGADVIERASAYATAGVVRLPGKARCLVGTSKR